MERRTGKNLRVFFSNEEVFLMRPAVREGGKLKLDFPPLLTRGLTRLR